MLDLTGDMQEGKVLDLMGDMQEGKVLDLRGRHAGREGARPYGETCRRGRCSGQRSEHLQGLPF